MEIDKYIRYSKILNQPHIHIYANEEELKSLSKRYYTCLADCCNDFKKYPEILEQIQYAFKVGIIYVEVKRGDNNANPNS